jgi:hypothetical protein
MMSYALWCYIMESQGFVVSVDHDSSTKKHGMEFLECRDDRE